KIDDGPITGSARIVLYETNGQAFAAGSSPVGSFFLQGRPPQKAIEQSVPDDALEHLGASDGRRDDRRPEGPSEEGRNHDEGDPHHDTDDAIGASHVPIDA